MWEYGTEYGLIAIGCMLTALIVCILSLVCIHNEKEKVASLLFRSAIGLFIVSVFFGILMVGCTPAMHRHHMQRHREEGARAYKLGVSSESNPYQGIRGCADISHAWLNGWMDAKEKDGKDG